MSAGAQEVGGEQQGLGGEQEELGREQRQTRKMPTSTPTSSPPLERAPPLEAKKKKKKKKKKRSRCATCPSFPGNWRRRCRSLPARTTPLQRGGRRRRRRKRRAPSLPFLLRSARQLRQRQRRRQRFRRAPFPSVPGDRRRWSGCARAPPLQRRGRGRRQGREGLLAREQQLPPGPLRRRVPRRRGAAPFSGRVRRACEGGWLGVGGGGGGGLKREIERWREVRGRGRRRENVEGERASERAAVVVKKIRKKVLINECPQLSQKLCRSSFLSSRAGYGINILPSNAEKGGKKAEQLEQKERAHVHFPTTTAAASRRVERREERENVHLEIRPRGPALVDLVDSSSPNNGEKTSCTRSMGNGRSKRGKFAPLETKENNEREERRNRRSSDRTAAEQRKRKRRSLAAPAGKARGSSSQPGASKTRNSNHLPPVAARRGKTRRSRLIIIFLGDCDWESEKIEKESEKMASRVFFRSNHKNKKKQAKNIFASQFSLLSFSLCCSPIKHANWVRRSSGARLVYSQRDGARMTEKRRKARENRISLFRRRGPFLSLYFFFARLRICN